MNGCINLERVNNNENIFLMNIINIENHVFNSDCDVILLDDVYSRLTFLVDRIRRVRELKDKVLKDGPEQLEYFGDHVEGAEL